MRPRTAEASYVRICAHCGMEDIRRTWVRRGRTGYLQQLSEGSRRCQIACKRYCQTRSFWWIQWSLRYSFVPYSSCSLLFCLLVTNGQCVNESFGCLVRASLFLWHFIL